MGGGGASAQQEETDKKGPHYVERIQKGQWALQTVGYGGGKSLVVVDLVLFCLGFSGGGGGILGRLQLWLLDAGLVLNRIGWGRVRLERRRRLWRLRWRGIFLWGLAPAAAEEV
ncbi:hypothetical protein M569_03142, partial [Genlisea aurea]